MRKEYMQKNNKHTHRPYPRTGNAVIVYSREEKETPKVGDRKMIKGVMHIRRYAMTTHLGQRVQLMSRGKPVFEWVPESEHKKGYSN
jgi:hypothetical protein